MAKGLKLSKRLPPGTQMAALCFRQRRLRKLQVLLITSRGSGRWIVPKGWPMKGLSAADTAASEAFEEAGVKGQVFASPLGTYKFTNYSSRGDARRAYVFALCVSGFAREFPEMGQRQVKWFAAKKAASLVREPQLKKIIRQFDPSSLPDA